jgi:hypothetical protein
MVIILVTDLDEEMLYVISLAPSQSPTLTKMEEV